MPQITIDLTAAQAARVLAWLKYTNPDATAADYKKWVLEITRDKVFAFERTQQQPAPFEPT